MKVYDEIIRKTAEMLPKSGLRAYNYTPGLAVRQGRKNELVMQREAAFELGEGSLPSVHYTAVTNSLELVDKDQILLYGKDLQELSKNSPFARITLLRTDDIEENGEQGAYSIIKNIEMKKFDVSPEGYMMRAAAMSNREQVRVAKTAVKRGLTFEQVGNLFISKYKENPHVKAVKIIFITLPNAPYESLDTLADSSVAITRALNHVIADLNMDCKHCQWKPVCDEVEGMKEMHIKVRDTGK